jgi:hypothetical protein
MKKLLVKLRQVFLSLLLVLTSACSLQNSVGIAQMWVHKGIWSKIPTIALVARENDPRLQVAREAIDFWNRTFVEIGSPFRLGSVIQITEEISVDYLKALSARVLKRSSYPDFPESIRRIPSDIIVVLSDGEFISFVARSPSHEKALVGIKNHQLYPLTLPNVTRNVIAHELGHAIGIGHNDDPTKLMCGRPAPCRPDAFKSDKEEFFPLTDTEKTILSTMYPINWRSR